MRFPNHESRRVRCVAHIINLAVQAFLRKLNASALDDENAYDEQYAADARRVGFIPRLRKLVVKVRESPLRRERFADQCGYNGIRPKELVIDVRTRWNSTCDMIERALELRKPLDKMTELDADLHRYKLTDGEWNLLKRIRKFFRLFKTTSNQLCAAGYPTLAIAVPAYNFLMDSLENYRDASSTSDAIKAATNAAIDKLKEYYTGVRAGARAKAGAKAKDEDGTDVYAIEVYAVATILDPHFKLQYYRNNGWKQEWIDKVKAAFDKAYARYRPPPAPDARENTPTELDDDDDGDVDVEGMRPMEYFYKHWPTVERDELGEYLSAPLVTSSTDTLQWWKANAGAYPCLAEMARDYLAIPATSVPVERVFSGGTDLDQPKRESLDKETIRRCMCLKYWLKLLMQCGAPTA